MLHLLATCSNSGCAAHYQPTSLAPCLKDDFLDCFGDPAVTGKIGTDIEDNKCSWLVVQALKKATPPQRAELEVCA